MQFYWKPTSIRDVYWEPTKGNQAERKGHNKTPGAKAQTALRSLPSRFNSKTQLSLGWVMQVETQHKKNKEYLIFYNVLISTDF